MKLKKLLPKSSKRGVTLVEAVMAVVVLTMFATGVLTLLTTGRTKIAETNQAANAHAAATQKMDAVIATISNGDCVKVTSEQVVVDKFFTDSPASLDTSSFSALLDGVDAFEVLTDCHQALAEAQTQTTKDNVRGWYLKLTYDGATVTGFASNTQGVFD